ncbi:HlyD family efflux transporter periplasmic adaptor subunit, partial [Acinetobacter baumannii]
IICPIDGWVSRRFENVGDSADPATPVFEIVKSGVELDFVGQASPSDAAKLVVGLRVEFETSAGKVVAVGAVNPQTGLATIRARFGKVDF